MRLRYGEDVRLGNFVSHAARLLPAILTPVVYIGAELSSVDTKSAYGVLTIVGSSAPTLIVPVMLSARYRKYEPRKDKLLGMVISWLNEEHLYKNESLILVTDCGIVMSLLNDEHPRKNADSIDVIASGNTIGELKLVQFIINWMLTNSIDVEDISIVVKALHPRKKYGDINVTLSVK